MNDIVQYAVKRFFIPECLIENNLPEFAAYVDKLRPNDSIAQMYLDYEEYCEENLCVLVRRLQFSDTMTSRLIEHAIKMDYAELFALLREKNNFALYEYELRVNNADAAKIYARFYFGQGGNIHRVCAPKIAHLFIDVVVDDGRHLKDIPNACVLHKRLFFASESRKKEIYTQCLLTGRFVLYFINGKLHFEIDIPPQFMSIGAWAAHTRQPLSFYAACATNTLETVKSGLIEDPNYMIPHAPSHNVLVLFIKYSRRKKEVRDFIFARENTPPPYLIGALLAHGVEFTPEQKNNPAFGPFKHLIRDSLL